MESEGVSRNGKVPPHNWSLPFRVGDAVIDPQILTITVNGESHHLTDLTWRFLIALMQQAPETATADYLAQEVWQQTHVSDETIAQRVRQLRQILGDDPKKPKYIRTVRGKGYQCIAEISQVSAQNNLENLARPRFWYRPLVLAVWGLAALAAVAGVGMILKPVPNETPQPTALSLTEELVLRADEYRLRGEAGANETAIDLYGKTLAIEAHNQPALIGLSFALSHQTSKFGKSRDHADKAAQAADRAILNVPNSAGAFAARGLADDARGGVSSAIAYYQRSLSLNPSDQSTRSSIAYLYQVQGRFHEAIRLEKQALEIAAPTYFSDYQIALNLDGAGMSELSQRWINRAVLLRPDTLFLADFRAHRHIKAGENKEAIAILDSLDPQLERHHVLKATAYLLDRNLAASRASTDAALLDAENNSRSCYACYGLMMAQGREVDHAAAAALLSSASAAIADGDEWPGYRVDLAFVYAAMGQDDAAMDALEQAYGLGYRDWAWLSLSPILRGLHGRDDFIALTAQMQNSALEERDAILSDKRLIGFLEKP